MGRSTGVEKITVLYFTAVDCTLTENFCLNGKGITDGFCEFLRILAGRIVHNPGSHFQGRSPASSIGLTGILSILLAYRMFVLCVR
ncbi:MAG: hypothetical protein WBD30_10325, partial [Bacteroidota bacterium]